MRVRIALLSFCLATLCFATVTPNLSLKDLVVQSDEIVTGYVVRSWPEWGTERKFIWTKYEISVRETLKGPHTASVVVSEPGGELDGKASHVAGSVPYQAGEHVTLFLHTFPSGVRRTVGWAQGKFQIDPSGRVQPAAGDRISYSSFRVTILNLMEKARN